MSCIHADVGKGCFMQGLKRVGRREEGEGK